MKKFYLLLCSVALGFVGAQNCTSISQLPFEETFEDSSTTRSCWTQEVVSGTPGTNKDEWVFKEGALNGNVVTAHGGELNARMQSWPYTDKTIVKLISPTLDLTSLETPTLSFFHAQEAWGTSQNELKVYYRLSPTSDWKMVENYSFSVANWTKRVISLPEKSAEMQFAFEGINYFGRSVVLDDVVIGNSDSTGGNTSCAPSTPSNNFESGNGDLNLLYIANDFSINAHTNLTVTQVKINIIQLGGIDNFEINFLDSNDYGTPNNLIQSFVGLTPVSKVDLHTEDNGYTFSEYTFDLPTPITLEGGATGNKIWMAVKATNTISDNASYWESTSKLNSGNVSYFTSNGTSWLAVNGNMDGVFTLVATCEESDPSSTYCIPRFTFLMPITHVVLNDLDNNSGLEGIGYEDFSSLRAFVSQDKTYDLQIEAATYPQGNQYITVFADWNNNGKLNDDGEVYTIGTINNSTGVDGQPLTYSLKIPADAHIGETRLRIMSTVSDYVDNPCSAYDQGQAEDYTLIVEEKILGTSDLEMSKDYIYPNPTSGLISIQTSKTIKNIEVMNAVGQKVMTAKTKDIDLSSLPSGVYLVKIDIEDGTIISKKVIKK